MEKIKSTTSSISINNTDINNKYDLYKVLELNSDASLSDIKKNFKRLALIYHPDKNSNSDANEKFNQIRIAYEILSDLDKKEKYDKMIEPKKKHFIDTIFLFLKQITNQKTIHDLINSSDIINDISNGNISLIAQKLIIKILDDIDFDIDISELTKIFICTSSINNSHNYSINEHQQKKIDSKSIEITEQSYNTSDFNTLNIFGNIKTNLDDIYHNRLKEIIIKRKIYNLDNSITNETNKYYIPLYDPKVHIMGAGDKIKGLERGREKEKEKEKDKDEIGNVILTIYCKKDKTQKIIRDNYDIIYNDKISLYELFNGFNKNIEYFNSILNVSSTNPLIEYKFDGDKISVNIINKGLPYDQDDNRGNLIINFYLIKSNNFNDILKKYFN
jgi:molecular chaperone DnaJ